MSLLKSCSPYLCMMVCQVAYGFMNVLLKIAIQQGLSHHILVAYRHLLAWAISAPLAYVLERSQRPSLSLPILVKIFFLALLGITIPQNIYFGALSYTSPTVAGAMSCVIPAATFILAVLLRMEKVRITTVRGMAKVFGTLLCVTGALVFTFCKGPLLKGFVTKPLIKTYSSHFVNGKGAVTQNWVKGSLIILTSQISFSAWIVFQGVICKAYPAKLSLNALMCFFASLQSSVEALIFERNKSSWLLGWNVQLAAVFYSGIVMSFFVYNLQIYCIGEKGPLFSAIFFPVMLLIMGFFSATCFAERLHLGSLIGAIVISLGLYCVVWGKNEEWADQSKKASKPAAEKETQIGSQNSVPCNNNGGFNHV